MKIVLHYLEFMALRLLLFIFGLMPIETASRTGGRIAMFLGPKMGISHVARANIYRAFPNKDQQAREKILDDMWSHIGQVIAEYAHLEQIATKRTKIIGADILQDVKDQGRAAIFIGGHISNFEVPSLAPFYQFGFLINSTYRAPNNPFVDRFLLSKRTAQHQAEAFPKSRQGGRQIVSAIKKAGWIGILIDQKYNEGVSVPFFGQDAMTNPAFVTLAQKFDLPVIPFRCVRVGIAQYQLIIYKPLPVLNDEGLKRDTYDVISDAHAMMEEWITEHPDQWLWLHRRWPKGT